MLLNLSNHPSHLWDEQQVVQATKLYGKIEDIPFPTISPTEDTDAVTWLAESYLNICQEKLKSSTDKINAVHLMGELTFTFALVVRLQRCNILCVASTAKRDVLDYGNGQKKVSFDFISFREYPNLNP